MLSAWHRNSAGNVVYTEVRSLLILTRPVPFCRPYNKRSRISVVNKYFRSNPNHSVIHYVKHPQSGPRQVRQL